MVERHPPFIVDEHGDVQIFGSETEMLDYIEPIDILNEEYRVWDSSGRQLLLTAGPKAVVDGPLQESDLEEVLRGYLRHLYEEKHIPDAPSDDLSIGEMIDIIQNFQRKPREGILGNVKRSLRKLWPRAGGG